MDIEISEKPLIALLITEISGFFQKSLIYHLTIHSGFPILRGRREAALQDQRFHSLRIPAFIIV